MMEKQIKELQKIIAMQAETIMLLTRQLDKKNNPPVMYMEPLKEGWFK